MKRIFLLYVIYYLSLYTGFAQDFQYLPPVITNAPLKDTSVSFFLSTFDMHRFKGEGPQLYGNSVQIIDADMPWPPRWYTSTPVYTDNMFREDSAQNLWRLYFVFDPKIDRGQFSFFKELTLTGINTEKAATSAGYIILNKKMEPVDTVRSKGKSTLYYHDFRINDKKEKLIDTKMYTYLDLRKASGDPKDSAVRSKIDIIQILDSNNKVIFSWNPIEHLDPNVFQFKESLKNISFSNREADVIEWSRLTSALFDYDGNILYSMRFVGIGKISRLDGHVMWHIDYTDIPIISGKDTARWYSIHDFEFVKDNDTAAIYSLYSLGDDVYPRAGGVVFERNKTTGKIKVIKYIWPLYKYKGLGQGSCDVLSNGDYLIDYGLFPEADTTKNFRVFTEYRNKNDSLVATYEMPRLVYAYKVHKLTDWPRPPRPKITLKGNFLHVSGPMQDWTWYSLDGPDNTVATKIGTGDTFRLRYAGSYCVEGKYGMGYAVSVPYRYKIKEKNEPY